MSASREFYHSDDYVVITIDIEDCPLVEFPLSELYDTATSTVVDNNLEVVHGYVTQVLEDTTWLDTQSALCLLQARLCIFYRRNEGELLTLRQPALQRLDEIPCDPIEVPLFIRFAHPEITFPCRTRFPPAIHRRRQSTTMICSDEAPGFDLTGFTPMSDVLCSSMTEVIILEEIISTFDMDRHTTLPTPCPGFSECQKNVVVTSERTSSALTYIRTLLPCHVTTPVAAYWADVSCQEAIEVSN